MTNPVLAEAAAAVGTDVMWLTHETRIREVVRERQEAMLWLFENRGMSATSIAGAMGLDRTTIDYGIKKARERRAARQQQNTTPE